MNYSLDYLLLGIDGASPGAFKKYDMKFCSDLLIRSKSLDLDLDLMSRGWVEIYSGLHATQSGGYYEKPELTGGYRWSKDFNHLSIPKKNKMIWDVLMERGIKVGVMNVPTTSPAPNVNGFFVSGGGGGRSVEKSVSEKQVSSVDLKILLDQMEYILDERVPSLLWEKKLFEPKLIFSQLRKMTEKRVSCFIECCKVKEVNFSFLVFRSFVVVEYLMSAEVNRFLSGGKDVNLELVSETLNFYKFFDSEIKRIFTALNPKKFAIVSDHGLVPRTHSVNINCFLSNFGYLKKPSGLNPMLAEIKKRRALIPFWLRKKLKNNSRIKGRYQEIIDFDAGKSKAFNVVQMGAINGIYINDSRFGGKVDSDKEELIEAIVKDFNSWNEACDHGMKARAAKVSGEYVNHYPDIVIDMPEGYMPVNNTIGFVERYCPSYESIDLKKVTDDNWTGIKSKYPLAVFSDNHKVDISGGGDLTRVYQIIVEELK